VVELWAMGREGEVVAELVPAFELRTPGVHVRVQQIPWSAAHEKLLTAYVGDAMPDVMQLGNTWLPELVALGAVAALDARIGATLLRDGARWGNFASPPVHDALAFYLGLFDRELAPRAGAAQVANVYQDFAQGYFALYVTGPWNLGEFARRLPPELANAWAT